MMNLQRNIEYMPYPDSGEVFSSCPCSTRDWSARWSTAPAWGTPPRTGAPSAAQPP